MKKKIIAGLLLAVHLSTFATTTTNAYQDAANAAAASEVLRQVEETNRRASEANDAAYKNTNAGLATTALSAAGNFGLGMGLAKGVQGAAGGTASTKTDTQSQPSDWSLKKKKLKPWEIILIAAFMARELREGFNEKKNGAQIDDGGFKNSIAKMKDTKDPRAKAVITLFKVIAHLSQEIGKNVSKLTGGLMAVGGALELMLIIFKEMNDPDEENLNTLSSVFKALIPQIFITTLIIAIISSGFLWQIYVGPLFAISMKLGGLIGGKTFSLYTLPDFITKMFNAPFQVMWAGFKSMFSPKYMINSIMPFMIILSGVFLLFITFKAICEIMRVLVDYILVGLFSTVVLGFMVLGITKSIGSGVIGAIMAAMMNVIVMFALTGVVFNIIDTLGTNTDLSPGRLLATICSLYVSTVLISMTKDIGMSIHSGTNASIQGSVIIDSVIDTAFQLGTFSAAVMGVNAVGAQELAKGLSPDKIAGMSKEQITSHVKKNFGMSERFSAGINALKSGDQSAVGKFFGTYAEKASSAQAWREQTKMLLKGEGGALENGNVFGKASKLAPQGTAASVDDILRGQQQMKEARKREMEEGKGKLKTNYATNTGHSPFQPQDTSGSFYANATEQAYGETAKDFNLGQEAYGGTANFSEDETEA